MAVTVPYTHTTSLTFTLDECNVGEVVSPAPVAADRDEAGGIARALDEPLGTPALEEMVHPGQQVLILSDDNTRPTPTRKILPPVLERLRRAGVAEEDIEVLIAAGTHRPMTDEEIEAKVGADVTRRIHVIRHRSYDPSALARAGTSSDGIEVWLNRKVVEADFVLGIGNVVPHPHAGWAGGAKILYPGVAGAETVAAFHLVGTEDPTNYLGRDDAPARRSLEALADTAGLDFIINTVLTAEHSLYRVSCGNPRQAQAAAREAARQVYGIPAQQRYPVVVVNSYPAYLEFWQAGKGLFAADLILEMGGTIILIAPCPEGIGATHPLQVEYLSLDLAELLRRIRARQVEDPIAAAVCAKVGHIKQRARVSVVASALSDRDVRRMGFEHHVTVEDALAAALAEQGRQTRVGVITHGGETVPYVA